MQGGTGTVIRSFGSHYRVRMDAADEEGLNPELDCTLRGKFRLQELNTTNPVAVGDHVTVGVEDDSPVIFEIAQRRNAILRKSTKLSSAVQVLAANVDQAIMVAPQVEPHTPLGFIDKFLVMCEAYQVPAILILNKTDLLKKEKDLKRVQDFHDNYQAIGYTVLAFNAFNPAVPEVMRGLLEGKTTFLAGLSGSGKSTLINRVAPDLNLKTGNISVHTNKGKHTTTYAGLYPLPFGGAVIDAPGFKEFDTVGITKRELSHFFPEMRALMNQCHYADCMHDGEPECAVRTATEAGKIAHHRYNVYLNILESLEK